ncbi:MAG: type II secretion system F family protein, partial [Caulobacter sp.]
MSDGPARFAYVAVDAAGRKVRGTLDVASESAAFASLKAQGLMPVAVKPARIRAESAARATGLSDRDTAGLVSDLAALLAAGSDIRTALTIIGGKAARPQVQAAAKAMARDISGGDALSAALERQLAERHRFIAALLAAGEVSSDMIGGLERGAEMLEARLKMRDQLVSVLAYPAFVMLTAVVSFLIILTLVVPSLAPLAEAPGAEPGLPMRLLLAASRFLTGNGWLLAGT